MDRINQALEIFEKDHADYLGMYRAGMDQARHIDNEDMGRLEQAAGAVQQHMDRIRLRQQTLAPLTPADFRQHPALEARRQQLVELINKIDRQRRANEATLHRALEQTRGEMKKFQQSRRAARGYSRKKGQGGRFVDGLR